MPRTPPLPSPARQFGLPGNVFPYLSAVIRYLCGDRGMHGTSTLSLGEGIRGYARTHTGTESANFAAAFSSPLSLPTPLLPPPLFESQGVALIGPVGSQGSQSPFPGGSGECSPCEGIRAHPGLAAQIAAPQPLLCSAPLLSFLLSFQRGVSSLSVQCP